MPVLAQIMQTLRSCFQPQPKIHLVGTRVDLEKTEKNLQVKKKVKEVMI